MPHSRTNYIVIYKGDSQVYSSSSKEIALTSPLPSGQELENKRVFFIAFEPDTEELCIYSLPQEEVQNAEITEAKVTKKEKKKDVEEV